MVSLEERARAAAYIEDLKITDVIESALNDACRTRPKDPFALMSNALKEKALPGVVVKLSGRESIGADLKLTVEATAHCEHHGRIFEAGRAVGSGCIAHIIEVSDPADPGAKIWQASSVAGQYLPLLDATSTRCGRRGTRSAAASIDGTLSRAVAGIPAADQRAADEALWIADSDELKGTVGINALLASSLAILEAGAVTTGVPVWAHVAKLSGCAAAVPIPCVVALSAGQNCGTGKLQVPGIWIAPPESCCTLDDGLDLLTSVMLAMQTFIVGKFGLPFGTPAANGGFAPKLDTLDSALDLVADVATSVGVEMPGGLRVIIDCGGSQDIYNTEKSKYELVTGKLLTVEDQLKAYTDLTNSRQYIAALRDPFREEDSSYTEQLRTHLASSGRHVVSSFRGTAPLRNIDHEDEVRGSTIAIVPAAAGTVSRMIEAAVAARASGMSTCVVCAPGDTTSLSADIACGLGVNYFTGTLTGQSTARLRTVAKEFR